jgi:drug/metabolite transporter (DMT)-like permease
MWILAAILGVGCAISFAVALLTTPDRSTSTPPTAVRESASNRGFGVGLVLGLGAGIAIGFAIARGRQSVDAAHSSRSKP